MKNIHFTPKQTTFQNCKSKTVIEVNSERFNNNENYQNTINKSLEKAYLFNNR